METLFLKADLILIQRAVQFIFFAAVVIAVIAYFSNEYTVVRVIKNILGVVLLILGAASAIYFIVAIFQGHLNSTSLFSAFTYYAIGLILRKWKLPSVD